MGHGPADALVLAVHHEIGNLLAAARLQAGLLARGGDADDAAPEIAALAARGGALLALARPLLGASAPRADAVAPAEILARLERELCDLGATGVVVETAAARSLAPVQADAEVVHAVLLAWILAALESSDPGEGVPLRVRAGERGADVELEVTGGAAGGGDAAGGRPSGRSLVRALAGHLLGARAEVAGDASLRRLALGLRPPGPAGPSAGA